MPKAKEAKEKKSTRLSAKKRKCRHCENSFSTRVIEEHENSCSSKQEISQGFEELAQTFNAQPSLSTGFVDESNFAEGLLGGLTLPEATMMPSDAGSMDLDPGAYPPDADAPQPNWMPQIDDIKVEYHPKSHRPTKFYHLDDYAAQEGRPAEEPVTDQEPWKPFRTRLDFEIAELMLDSHLNVGQSSVLLSLIRKAIAQPADFTLSSTDELEKFWTAALDYKAEEIEFQVSTRPIWSWIEDIVDNGNIVPLFKWDAEHRYRYNGSKWERFINEPCTADDWWNIQVNKSRLSSFGTAKGYPVFAQCTNLPADIRNGKGTGGGRLVGWLPIVSFRQVQILHQVTEDAGETRKKGYVNFKHIVWHKSLYEILDSIWLHGKTGFLKTCGDNIARWLWPIILILSADYEEQCIMTLIHGLGSNGPCPVCLVPPDELADLSKTFNLRTKENMMKIYKQAQELNATDKEELLKIYGLRDVENVFWDFKYCDPYQATSWDGLHAHDSSLFGAHILPELKCLVDVLGKEYAKLLDTQVDKTPRWSGLNHFREVMKMDFTDGGKFSDIAKLVLFAAYNILTKDDYLELHMYTSLSLHSESTIEAGEKALLAFEIARQEYSRVSPTKNWHFIKAHSHKHVFNDIMRKGVTRNFSTKPNEKAHSPLKDFYQLMTNFKNFGVQILKLNEKDVISTMIREQITILDELAHRKLEEEVNNSTRKHHLIGTEHVSLSSALAPCTQLGKGLTSIFCTRIDVGLYDEVSLYQALHVSYESMVSWGITTDIVHAHPNFYNSPRYDCVLVDAGQGKHFFARLLYIFGIFVESEVQYLALILPFDVPIPRIEQPRATFIHIESIVHGALLIPAHDSQEYSDEFLVFDQLDEDFWMRMKSLQLAVSLNL
ncbi:hypothetical protein CPB84DRAFT_1815674 [Gymnopilus junonius]|uniref:Uncharacterized protein n=1 Tax=Gymnopilus junonius TaxID=109634 RepID=A0A9P5TMI5_GYMJU|nr:hypothetical protein CPB84DRAFT_1815674 [Gymnopilus junonius]